MLAYDVMRLLFFLCIFVAWLCRLFYDMSICHGSVMWHQSEDSVSHVSTISLLSPVNQSLLRAVCYPATLGCPLQHSPHQESCPCIFSKFLQGLCHYSKLANQRHDFDSLIQMYNRLYLRLFQSFWRLLIVKNISIFYQIKQSIIFKRTDNFQKDCCSVLFIFPLFYLPLLFPPQSISV